MPYVSKVYRKQGGDEFVVASGGAITVESGGTLTVAGVTIDDDTLAMTNLTASAAEMNELDGIAATVTVAIAASSTTDGMDITITAKDAAGGTVAAVHQLEFWMSEDPDGIGLTADTYSGDLTAIDGAILSAHTAKKHWSVVTDDAGVFTATLVASANPADQYVACKKPLGGAVVVSDISDGTWEGA